MEIMLDTLALKLVKHGPSASHQAVSSLVRAVRLTRRSNALTSN